jgi:hypothetical protein
MKMLTKEQELEKREALDIISDITSVRNPNRMEDIALIKEIFGKKAKELKQ